MRYIDIKGANGFLNLKDKKSLQSLIAETSEYEIHIHDSNFGIINQLIDCGVDEHKIVMISPNAYNLGEFLKKKNGNNIRFDCSLVLTRKMVAHDEMPFYSESIIHCGNKFIYNDDYVRYGTLKLIAEEIKINDIEGDIAELGVFRGDFACILNHYFPERVLHLFDTFEGFDEKDLHEENNLHIAKTSFLSDSGMSIKKGMLQVGAFSNTSVELVLGKMDKPDKCRIHKGFFPDTKPDENISYALVSLDCDLYAPILGGMRYFYPRLQIGGYIMLHDYNGLFYDSVHKAVMEFEKEYGEHIRKVPIPDEAGTIVIAK